MTDVRDVIAAEIKEQRQQAAAIADSFGHGFTGRPRDENLADAIVRALKSANIELIQWRTDWENAPRVEFQPMLFKVGRQVVPGNYFEGQWNDFYDIIKPTHFALLPSGGE